MSYRRLFLLYSFILILVVSKNALSDHASTDNLSADPPASSGHPIDNSGLRQKEIDLLTKAFQTDDDFIKAHYGERLPAAFGGIKDGNEDGIASVISELMGTVNDTQLNALADLVTKEMKDEKISADPRLMSLLKRLLWAKEILMPPAATPDKPVALGSNDPAYPKFKEAFEKAWKKTKEHNDEFYTQLDLALNKDNEEAKRFLRTHYDPKALLGFLEAQGSTGNEKLANELSRALAVKRDEGELSIDVLGANQSKDRILLGKEPAKLFDNLKNFSTKTSTPLRTLTFSSQPHPKIDRLFRDGNLVAPDAKSDGPKTQQSKPPVEAPKPDLAKLQKAAEAIMKDNCADCHGPDGSSSRVFSVGENGEVDKAHIEAVLRRVVKGIKKNGQTGKFMPPGRNNQLSDSDKEKIKAWAKANGVE